MILIADSGSTKSDWVVLGENKEVVLKTKTKGINPQLLTASQIFEIIDGNNDLKSVKENIDNVLFYGAGCGGEDSKLKIEKVLISFFLKAKVKIEEDLTAAVHGTTSSPGVICILGTGSNCCYFDGKNIIIHQASLGYAIMDEGSGNFFGKQLLKSYFYNKMPLELHEKFKSNFNLSLESVLKSLYEDENPSAYLAGFARFLIENRSNNAMAKIINVGVFELFDNLIMCYSKELEQHPIHFVGSIAYYLQEDIKIEANKRGIKIGSFVKKPMDNLVANINDFFI